MGKPEDLHFHKVRAFDDGWGFNKYALRVCMEMAGYEPTVAQLGRLLNCSYRQADYKMNYAKFTRHDIAVLQAKLHMDGQQLIDTFFNGRYPNYKRRDLPPRKRETEE